MASPFFCSVLTLLRCTSHTNLQLTLITSADADIVCRIRVVLSTHCLRHRVRPFQTLILPALTRYGLSSTKLGAQRGLLTSQPALGWPVSPFSRTGCGCFT
eukprot:3354102-Pyramimonas_sp.AAC.1